MQFITFLHFINEFQSTLLQEERPSRISSCTVLSTYFNPRSYKRSDIYQAVKLKHLEISIHAPTRGATFAKHLIYQIVAISIHAPTRGATLKEDRPISKQIISIHAPTRGATLFVIIQIILIHNFNPRSYKRSDRPHFCGLLNANISIHAPTRGATLRERLCTLI